jgi:hypothetical protein
MPKNQQQQQSDDDDDGFLSRYSVREAELQAEIDRLQKCIRLEEASTEATKTTASKKLENLTKVT